MITQLGYYSRNLSSPSQDALIGDMDSILAVSQRNNQRDGITGFLLADRDWFIQILEGEPEAVAAAYARIQGDPRHGDVATILSRSIRGRSFPQWSMGGTIRGTETRAIFERHGIGDHIDPTMLLIPSIIALAMDLQDYERGIRIAS